MATLIRLLAVFTVCICLSHQVFAQRELKNIPAPDPDLDLEKATFKVPEGFEVTLFASDPSIAKPIQTNARYEALRQLLLRKNELYFHRWRSQPDSSIGERQGLRR